MGFWNEGRLSLITDSIKGPPIDNEIKNNPIKKYNCDELIKQNTDNYRKIKRNILEPIERDPFKLEKEIQTIIETNMETLFGIELVKSEFSLGGFFAFIESPNTSSVETW